MKRIVQVTRAQVMELAVVLLSVLVIVLSVTSAYQYMAWQIDKDCRQYMGWEYKSLFPDPVCSLPGGYNATPLNELKRLFANPFRFDNTIWLATY